MALSTPERSCAFDVAFTSPQSVLEPVASRRPKYSSTAYCFAAADKDKPSGGRQIHWDPNAPGCFGVSQDDGSFRYCTPDGGSVCFNLFVSAGGPTDEPGLRPTPMRTKWSQWTFVPGQAGTILFAHHNSDQLLQTCVPGAALLGVGAGRVAHGEEMDHRPRKLLELPLHHEAVVAWLGWGLG